MPPEPPPNSSFSDPKLPRWCCAILIDPTGNYLLEKRPLFERDAPGMLTCFGGTREPMEHPAACLARELKEELGFELPAPWLAQLAATDIYHIQPTVTLHTPQGIAWFFSIPGPSPSDCTAQGTPYRALEPGFEAVWIPRDQIFHTIHSLKPLFIAPLAPWTRASLKALQEGQTVATVDR